MKGYYDVICQCCPEYKQFQFQEFCEVMALINSRAFDVTIGGKESFTMVPYADMLNHSYRKSNYFRYDDDMEGFVICN